MRNLACIVSIKVSQHVTIFTNGLYSWTLGDNWPNNGEIDIIEGMKVLFFYGNSIVITESLQASICKPRTRLHFTRATVALSVALGKLVSLIPIIVSSTLQTRPTTKDVAYQ